MDQDQLDQQIIRSFQGRLSAASQRQLNEWRQQTGQNEQYFQKMKAVWVALGPETISSDIPQPTAAEIIQQSRGMFGENELRRGGFRSRSASDFSQTMQ